MMHRRFYSYLLIATLAGCSPHGQGEVSPLDALARCAEQFTGEGSNEEDLATVRRLRPKADSGDISAQFELCWLGRGQPTASSLLVSASDAGHAEAQLKLSVLAHVGRGVPQDRREADRLLRLAAQNGLAEAQYRLGERYRDGDPEEAVRWLRMASEQGHQRAMFIIAFFFDEGIGGLPQNPILGYMWRNIALSQDRIQSRYIAEFRNEMNLTTAQIVEAEAMATRCFNSGYQECGW